MTTPTDDQLAAAAQKARADHETAREIAARLLAPPDPVDILAGVIADRGEVADERDELQAKCDALTAERDDLRAGLSEIACCFTSDSMAHVLSAQTIVFAIADLNTRVADLSSFLATAEADAETQRTAADDLRAALDRVAVAAGVDTDSTGAIVADRVIAVFRAMQARPVLTVERLADALRAANVTLEPSTTALIAMSTMGTMSHMGDIVLPKMAALPADLRTYLETLLNRLQGTDGLAVAAETAALKRWIALPTAEVAP